jgi:hypothetical protein
MNKWQPTVRGLVWLDAGPPARATHAYRMTKDGSDLNTESLCGQFSRREGDVPVSRRAALGVCRRCRKIERGMRLPNQFVPRGPERTPFTSDRAQALIADIMARRRDE